jgi:uncharacterized membrane protein (DUF4010 family)
LRALAQQGSALKSAALAVLLAILSNFVVKVGTGWAIGGRKVGLRLAAISIIAFGAGVVSLMIGAARGI